MDLRNFTRRFSYRSLAVALYLVTMLLGLILTSGDYLDTALKGNSWLGPAVVGVGVLAGIAVVFYNRWVIRLVAGLFPLLMVVILVFNLTEDKIGWSLRRQPTNSLLDLSSGIKDYAFYLYLAEHYENATLVVAPDLLSKANLSEWALQDWGRLRAVKIESYSPALTQTEVKRLIAFNATEVDTQYGTFVFVFELDPSAADKLYLAHYEESTYIITADIFASLRATPR